MYGRDAVARGVGPAATRSRRAGAARREDHRIALHGVARAREAKLMSKTCVAQQLSGYMKEAEARTDAKMYDEFRHFIARPIPTGRAVRRRAVRDALGQAHAEPSIR